MKYLKNADVVKKSKLPKKKRKTREAQEFTPPGLLIIPEDFKTTEGGSL